MTMPDRLDLRRQDLAQVYRPQREWIDGRGLLIVVAHFFSGIGAGAWLWSTLYGFRLGQAIGFACVVALSGVAHLAFLGRWERFWRILRRPHRSWISRGIWAIGVFAVSGGWVLVAGFGAGAGAGALLAAATAVSVGAACGVLLYEGSVSYTHLTLPTNREV